jgi:hypothetical protein
MFTKTPEDKYTEQNLESIFYYYGYEPIILM